MIYINGTAAISPQPTFGMNEFLSDIRAYHTNMLQCIEPDYRAFFHPNALRRISRVLKLGWAGAKICLDDAGISMPDSICIGTGKGCFKSTETFMFSVDDNREQLVPPSPFIQSPHGSIAAQIAIQTGCRNYNMTYSHRAFSFESALIDAMMLLKEGRHDNVLLGGVDEIQEIQFKTFERIGYYKKPDTSNLNLLDEKSEGTIAGEGSTYFLLENKPAVNTYAAVKSVRTFSNPPDTNETGRQIKNFLREQNLAVKDIDLLLLGMNGDSGFDGVYHDLSKTVFTQSSLACYKHLCGEYHTSSAFALWLAAHMIREQKVPKILRLNDFNTDKIKNVLIYNQYRNINHSLILVSKHEN